MSQLCIRCYSTCLCVNAPAKPCTAYLFIAQLRSLESSHLRLLALPYPREWGGHREDERNRNWAGNCRRTLAPQRERKNGKNFLATFTTFVATKLFFSLCLLIHLFLENESFLLSPGKHKMIRFIFILPP